MLTMKITPQSIEIQPEDVEFGYKILSKLTSFRLPRNQKDKIGIIVAINCENDKERQENYRS